MEKTAKIDLSTFTNIVEGLYSPTENIVWNGLEITINKTLSLTDMMTFVDNVTKMCFTETDGTYLPEIKDFAIKSCVLEMYANFSLPEGASERYALIYSTNVVDAVLNHVNRAQFNEIIESINDKLDNLAQANIEMINRQMDALYTAFDNLQKQLSGMFEGVSSDDVTNLFSAISGGMIDEEKLIKAYIKQSASPSVSGNVVQMPIHKVKGSDE